MNGCTSSSAIKSRCTHPVASNQLPDTQKLRTQFEPSAEYSMLETRCTPLDGFVNPFAGHCNKAVLFRRDWSVLFPEFRDEPIFSRHHPHEKNPCNALALQGFVN